MLDDLMMHIAGHGELHILNPAMCASIVCQHMCIITLLQGAGIVMLYACLGV